MNENTVKIWRSRMDGKDVYCVRACGHYAEFPTQVDAAEFAEKCLEERKNAEK